MNPMVTLSRPFVPAKPRAEDAVVPDAVRELASGEKLRTESLRAWFGKTEAIKGISLPIPERRVTAIIGPSG